MDSKKFDNLIKYYKNEQEDNKKYNERLSAEERDVYRVIKCIKENDSLDIANFSDFSRLLIAAKNITLTYGENIYEKFISVPSVFGFMERVSKRIPEIENYVPDEIAWGYEHPSTPLEQSHEQVEDYIRTHDKKYVEDNIKQIKSIINAEGGRTISLRIKDESSLTQTELQSLELAKMMIRTEGKVPSGEISFNNNRARIKYKDGEFLLEEMQANQQQKQSMQSSTPQSQTHDVSKKTTAEMFMENVTNSSQQSQAKDESAKSDLMKRWKNSRKNATQDGKAESDTMRHWREHYTKKTEQSVTDSADKVDEWRKGIIR